MKIERTVSKVILTLTRILQVVAGQDPDGNVAVLQVDGSGNLKASGASDPAANAGAVTPSDSTDLTNPARGLLCTVAGDVCLITTGGDTITVPMLAGIVYPIRTARVKATGTTGSVVALW